MLTVPCAAVMNYTEMEAKVREATNNEPWGASST
jgi:epsin